MPEELLFIRYSISVFLLALVTGCGSSIPTDDPVQIVLAKDVEAITIDDIEILVAAVSWDCMRYEYNYLIEVELDCPVAGKLIVIGKPATDSLVSALLDPGKVVPTGYILARIWETNSETNICKIECDEALGYSIDDIFWSVEAKYTGDLGEGYTQKVYDWWAEYVRLENRPTA